MEVGRGVVTLLITSGQDIGNFYSKVGLFHYTLLVIVFSFYSNMELFLVEDRPGNKQIIINCDRYLTTIDKSCPRE